MTPNQINEADNTAEGSPAEPIQLGDSAQAVLQQAARFVPPQAELEPRQLMAALLVSESQNLRRMGVDVDALASNAQQALIDDAPDEDPGARELKLSMATRQILGASFELAQVEKAASVEAGHLFVAAVRGADQTVREFFDKAGLDRDKLIDSFLMTTRDQGRMLLEKIGEDWTAQAAEGKLLERVGRESETDRLIEILLHKHKRNPLLIGPAGVGKDTIVQQLALRLAAGEVPDRLADLRIIYIHPDRMFSGVNNLQDFSTRVEQLSRAAADGKTVLYLEDIQRYVIDESGKFNAALANVVKGLIISPGITIIAATSTLGYFNYVESDPALGRRFYLLRVNEPDEDTAQAMLEDSAAELEKHHGVKITRAAISGSIRLAGTYLRHRRFPDSAIGILDQAAARTYLIRGGEDHEPQVRLAEVEETVAEMTGINSPGITADLREKFRRLEEYLSERVIGQEEAVKALSGVIRYTKSRFDVNSQRPDGVLLFIGPAGSGKSKMAGTVAEFFFGSDQALIDLQLDRDQNENQLGALVAQEGPSLVNLIRQLPNGVVLFDNIDKAQPETRAWIKKVISQGWNLDAAGNIVHFSDATIIMTAFRDLYKDYEAVGYSGDNGYRSNPDRIRLELEKHLGADFLNHIDDIIFFRDLTEDDCYRILKEKLLPRAQEKMAESRINLEVTDQALRLVAKEGFSPTFGASYLKNTFQRMVLVPAANRLFTGELGRQTTLRILLRNGELVVQKARK